MTGPQGKGEGAGTSSTAAPAAATGSPYLDRTFESIQYAGPIGYICNGNAGSMNLLQGRQFFICAVVYPTDAAGHPNHATAGDPVDSLTGAFTYHPDRADLGYAARGGGLAFARSYSSDASRSNRFGPGWSDSYDAALTVDATTGNVTYHDPSGSIQVFTKSGTTYSAPIGIHSVLAAASGGGWTLTFKDQTVDTFDANGLLTSVLERNGQGTTLNWSAGKLSSAFASGRTITLAYNTAGLVSGLTGSDGRTVAYLYDTSGRLQTVTDAAGFKTTHAYDANGLLASVQDPNLNYPIRLTYDPTSHRVTKQLDPDGNTTTFGWTQTGADTGTGTATVTDPRGKTITHTYSGGYLYSQTDADGNVSQFAWDGNATLTSYTDPLKNSTYFSYDSAGNLTSRAGSDNYSEQYTYNGRNDLTQFVDFSGNKTTYTYDSYGNLATVTRASITCAPGTVTAMQYTYNADGTLKSATDALSRTTQYGYTTQGDLVSVTSPGGQITTDTVDAAGRATSTVEPRGNVTGANPDTYRTTMTWDNLDRVTSTKDPLGHTTATFYDPTGRIDHLVDAKGGTTAYTSGTTTRPRSVQGPDPSVGPQKYTYDVDGNVATATSPAGVVTTYTYTSNNAVNTISSTGTGTWTYDHDAAGRISKATAPSGRSVTMTRTPKGLVSKLAYSDATPPVSFTYDQNGNRYTMTDGRGTSYYTYNAINQLASVIFVNVSNTYKYAYDEAGEPISRQLPDGSTPTQYAYDKDGRLTAVTSGTTTLAAYAYDPTTGTVTTSLQGGVTSTLQIDAARRPMSVQSQKSTTVLTKSQYTLDELGNPTQIANIDGTTDSYAYSPLSRLQAACYAASTCSSTAANANFRYSYDGDGNIASVVQPAGTTNYTYDTAGRVTGRSGLKGTAAYQYDADGNTTSDGTSSYNWNAASQLTSVTTGTATTSYAYDGDSHRTGTTAGTTTTTSTYDPINGKLALEQQGNKNTTVRKYDYGIGLVSMTTGSNAYSYLTDALGSVRGVTDPTGALVLGYSYNPYGDARSSTASGKNPPQNPLQFAGSYLTTPLYRMGARDYSPVDGRFLIPDPAGVPGRGYTYAAGNPLAFIDPSGLSEYDWRKMVNSLANGISTVAGTVAVVCIEAAPILGGLSFAASAVEVATSDQTSSCLSGHGACDQAIVSGAMVFAFGKFGVGGKAAGALETGAASALRHYTTQEAADAISKGGEILPGLSSGKIWLTPDKFATGAEAQAKLALNRTPDGYFEIPACRVQCPSTPSTVQPLYGQPGGGTEVTTQFPIDVGGLQFVRF
ncbi:RHS repeat-associated core domain-containing protein [Sinomonas sp. ASV322]|uniref:RHS repeat-associated core domain-containing protein n=1 Tax=Sinomonas sp. ASV322 TaxID=3041920 RepID=UPI0027DC1E29|nr:RHS repeat-associated core domain-containing protein [Sinomonas sp. ASV322]MDQ4504321.1 RHS repeat-associated core domain-containing protein [Sinomonas sp. ASV322]